MWALLPLIIAGAARAQSNGLDAYLTSVCMPSNATGYPDLDVPCNAAAAIQAQCLYGPGWLDNILNNSDHSSLDAKIRKRSDDEEEGDEAMFNENDNPTQQGAETQRVCLCESQFWDQITGCMACYKAHGGDMALEFSVPDAVLTSASSAYCVASATATAGLDEYLYGLITGLSDQSTSQPTETASVSFRDSIGNKTEVSYYYTAAVTGTAAWSLSQPTATSGSASYTTTNVVDGLIRPTASQNNEAAVSGSSNPSGSSGGNGGGASETGNAAGRYEAAGAAGIFGFAGLLALL